MKEPHSGKKKSCCRLIFKVGSIVFLAFFTFCALFSPLAAPLVSLCFILGGCLLSPLFNAEAAADNTTLPPQAKSAIYAPAQTPDSGTVNDPAGGLQISPEFVSDIPCIDKFATEKTQFRFHLFKSDKPSPADIDLNVPIRAGPACVNKTA